MKYIVDRITEGIAVCEKEDETMARFPLSLLPEGTKEGSVLHEENGIFSLAEDETEDRRSALFDLQNALFGDDGEDDESGDASASSEPDDEDFFSYRDEDA